MTNEAIGKNVSALRRHAGVSQTALAEVMKTRGFKWVQATVWSVEQAERPLKFTEALALCEIFDCSPESLAGGGDQLDIDNALQRASEAWDNAEAACNEYWVARNELAVLAERADGLPAETTERVAEALRVRLPLDEGPR